MTNTRIKSRHKAWIIGTFVTVNKWLGNIVAVFEENESRPKYLLAFRIMHLEDLRIDRSLKVRYLSERIPPIEVVNEIRKDILE